MKILIDARMYGLENSGIGRYLINLLNELAILDSENSYIVLLRKKYFQSLRFPNNWNKVLTDFPHYGLKEQFLLPKIIGKINYDTAHFPHFNVPIFIKNKFVVTIHDLIMHKKFKGKKSFLPTYLYFIKRFFYKMVFKNAVLNASKIIVPSNVVKKDLLSSYKKINHEKVLTIYEGVSVLARGNIKRIDIYKKYEIDSPYFIYTGNIYPHKNINRLIDAIDELNHKIGKILLVIVTPKNKFYSQMLKYIKINNKSNIKLLSFIPDSELSVLYNGSLAFVYPSLSEGFGLPGLEAMRSNTIAAVSDIPIFKEIYKNYAIYFNPLDYSDIAKVLKNIYELPEEKRKLIIKNNHNLLFHYSWKSMAKNTLKVYKEAINESSNSIRSSK